MGDLHIGSDGHEPTGVAKNARASKNARMHLSGIKRRDGESASVVARAIAGDIASSLKPIRAFVSTAKPWRRSL